MPDSTLQEAIKEAYATAPADKVILYTLELRHPAFTEPIRVVRNHVAFDATLEIDAPVDPGALVTFQAFAFSLQLPEVSMGGNPEIVIDIDNVSREIVANIEKAVVTPYMIEVTFRVYLMDDPSGPQNNPPMHMVVRSISADVFKVTARAGFGDLSRMAYPKLVYTLERFPALARS